MERAWTAPASPAPRIRPRLWTATAVDARARAHGAAVACDARPWRAARVRRGVPAAEGAAAGREACLERQQRGLISRQCGRRLRRLRGDWAERQRQRHGGQQRERSVHDVARRARHRRHAQLLSLLDLRPTSSHTLRTGPLALRASGARAWHHEVAGPCSVATGLSCRVDCQARGARTGAQPRLRDRPARTGIRKSARLSSLSAGKNPRGNRARSIWCQYGQEHSG